MVEIRELVAGEAVELVALFAAVLPDSPTAQVDRLDEPVAFLRDSASEAARRMGRGLVARTTRAIAKTLR